MKKQNLILLSLMSALIILVYGCYYDNEEYLYPSIVVCDSTSVSYSKNITQTLASHCLGCHGPSYAKDGNNIRLESYSDVVKYLDRIVGSINHSPQNSWMPKNAPKMNDCLINQFVRWQSAQAPNN